MKCKDEPCQDWKHEPLEEMEYFACPICGHSYERRCTRCGWYLTVCLCGAENGWSKISIRQQAAIDRRKAEKAGKR